MTEKEAICTNQKNGKFCLNIRRHFFIVTEAKRLSNRLPRELVESPPLEIV